MQDHRPPTGTAHPGHGGGVARAALALSTRADVARGAVAAKLAIGLRARPGHVVVTGPDADAAAALLADAERQTPPFRVVRVAGRALDPDRVVHALTDTPGTDALRPLVERARAAGRPILIVVTHAELAEARQLERLRTTLAATDDAADTLRMVLLGGPTLLERLRARDMRTLAARVGLRVRAPSPDAAGADWSGSPGPDAPERPSVARLRWTTGAIVAGVTLVVAGAIAFLPLRRDVPPLPPPVAREPPSPPPLAAREIAPPAPPPPHAVATEPSPEIASASDTGTSGLAADDVPPQTTTVDVAPPPDAPAPVPSPMPAAPAVVSTPTRAAATPPPPPAAAGGGPVLQVGAFRQPANARRLAETLSRRYQGVHVSAVKRSGVTYHRVRIQGLADDAAARRVASELRATGHDVLLVPGGTAVD